MLIAKCKMDRSTRLALCGLALGILLSEVATVWAQHYVSSQLPPSVTSLFSKMGNRYQKPGKELMILTGKIADADGSQAAVQIAYELPTKIRFERLGSNGGVLVFDSVLVIDVMAKRANLYVPVIVPGAAPGGSWELKSTPNLATDFRR